MPLSWQRPSKVLIVGRIMLLISKFDLSSWRSKESKLFSSRSPCVSLVRRFVSFNTICRYFSCLSGGIVPSIMASIYPLIEVRGERKSWDILEMKDFRYSLERLSSSAISSIYRASSPNSLSVCTSIRALKFPAAYCLEVAMISMYCS